MTKKESTRLKQVKWIIVAIILLFAIKSLFNNSAEWFGEDSTINKTIQKVKQPVIDIVEIIIFILIGIVLLLFASLFTGLFAILIAIAGIFQILMALRLMRNGLISKRRTINVGGGGPMGNMNNQGPSVYPESELSA